MKILIKGLVKRKPGYMYSIDSEGNVIESPGMGPPPHARDKTPTREKKKIFLENKNDKWKIKQTRERIFIVGFLDKSKAEKFLFPEEISLTKNFRDLIKKEVEDKYYYNDKPLYERIKNEINSEFAVYQWRRKYVRTNKKGVVPTLTANMGRGGHNVPIIKNSKGIRKLTPKECFLLQGFPEEFKKQEKFYLYV